MKTLKFIESIKKLCWEGVIMSRLTRTARHVALDSHLTRHIGLHQNSLQHLTSRWDRLFFYMVQKRCPMSGSLTLEPRTTDSLSITSTNISLFPPWINAHKKCKNLDLFQQVYHSQTLEICHQCYNAGRCHHYIWNILCTVVHSTASEYWVTLLLHTCSLLDWMGLVAAELGATLLCCVSAPNWKKTVSISHNDKI